MPEKDATAESFKRVGAILDAKDGIVRFLGFGEIVAQEIPPQSITDTRNPKIRLDNGNIVWGYECWWNSVEIIESYLQEAATVEEVDINEERTQSRPKIDRTIEPLTPVDRG